VYFCRAYDFIINTQIRAYVPVYCGYRLVPHVYIGLAFIGDPAIIRDPAFICTFDKKPLAFKRDMAFNGTWLLLKVMAKLDVYLPTNLVVITPISNHLKCLSSKVSFKCWKLETINFL